MIAAVIKELMAAGVTGDALVTAIERIELSTKPKRTAGAERQARYRERNKASRNVTERNANEASHVTSQASHNVTSDNALSLSSSLTLESINESKEEKKERGARGKRNAGHPLPDDWQPHAKHYATGEALGLNRSAVDALATGMRSWAKAEAHRPIAKKSDWNSAFYGWINKAKTSVGHRPLTPSEQQKVKSDDALRKLREYNERDFPGSGGSHAGRDVSEGHGGGAGILSDATRSPLRSLSLGGAFRDPRPVERDSGEVQIFAVAGRN